MDFINPEEKAREAKLDYGEADDAVESSTATVGVVMNERGND